MKKENKKILYVITASVLAVILVLLGIYAPDNPAVDVVEQVQNIVLDEIKTIDESVVVEDITENAEVSSDETTIEEVSIEEEQELEAENIIKEETEGFELQGDISYDGDRAKSWDVELGDYQGLTYYSQIDNRWSNQIYTSSGNYSQTIGSSGCGPTCASMIVSSIKGIITPDIMATLFVKNGYRSANNGTYWSAYRAVADEFNIGYQETADINKVIDLLKNNNYVICSVGNGLFTTGGHYIVIVGIEGNTLKIYDPYNYSGKFNTSTRRGKVVVEGNTIYCTVDNFRKYANYKSFFCYQNVEHSKFKAGERVLVDVPVGICCYSGDHALVDDYSSQFWIHKSVLTNDSRVYGLADIAFDGGYNDIVQIFSEQFWCSEKNMSSIPFNTVQAVQIPNTVGQSRKLKQASIIYSNSNLTGSKFNYRANTTITILENITTEIDKIKINQTGRIGYINKKYYK